MPIPLGVLAVAGAGGGGLTATYELISTSSPSDNTSSVTFSSLDTTTYKHFQIRFLVRAQSGSGGLVFRMNGNTGANYFNHNLRANGSSIASGNNLSRTSLYLGNLEQGSSTGNFTIGVLDILDASSTNKIRTIRCFYGTPDSTGNEVGLISGAFNSTAALTSFTFLFESSNTFNSATRISLYGIRG